MTTTGTTPSKGKKATKSMKATKQTTQTERVCSGVGNRPPAQSLHPAATSQRPGEQTLSSGKPQAQSTYDANYGCAKKTVIESDGDTDDSSLSTTCEASTFAVEASIFTPLSTERFYVRSCYPDYYDHVMDAFDIGVGVVTVTGAPEIGKSVFLAYFLHRYQLQHPNCTFVYASYDRRSKFQRALVWKNGSVEAELTKAQLLSTAKDDPDTIFLLDGAPNRLPWSTAHRFVVCTSPNAVWDKKTGSYSGHMQLFMPLWELDELTAAIDALDLQIKPMSSIEDFPRQDGEAEMEYRLRVFGGIACPCLETQTQVVNSYVQTLKRAAYVVDLRTGHRPRGADDQDNVVSHELFHNYASTDLYFSEVKTASPYVTQLLSARVGAIPTELREDIEFTAASFPAASALRQSILATRMLRSLQSGVRLVANSLAHPPESQEFDLPLSISDVSRTLYSNRFQASDLARSSCYVLQGDAFESILAVFLVDKETAKVSKPWDDVEAVVFLAPSKFIYSVQGRRLYALLNQLGLARDAPRRVALVFGVDEEGADGFEKQSIGGGCPVEGNAPLTAVDHITTEMATKLQAANINTAFDLWRRPIGLTLDEELSEVYERACEALAIHENEAVVSGTATHAMLTEIPQFVWGLKE